MRLLVASTTLVVTLLACYLFFYGYYDESDSIANARALIGKPAASVRLALGMPDQVIPARHFNAVKRGHVIWSFQPDDVPFATGNVFVYNRIPTIILVFTNKGRVTAVYAGKT